MALTTREIVLTVIRDRLRAVCDEEQLMQLSELFLSARNDLIPAVNTIICDGNNLSANQAATIQLAADEVDQSEHAQRQFESMLDVVFSDNIHWGRISTVVNFAADCAHKAVIAENHIAVHDIVSWTVQYFRDFGINIWIREHGGWENFPDMANLVFADGRRQLVAGVPRGGTLLSRGFVVTLGFISVVASAALTLNGYRK